jgi:mRNA interferase MazF
VKVPERGDLVFLDFDPQAGHEQMKRRPALVLSSAAFNAAFGLAFVAPVTTKPKGHAFELPLPPQAGIKGAVMVQQLKSFDWRVRRARLAGKVPPEILAAATEIINDIIAGE